MKDGPEYLKMERLRRGWTLQDASDRTQINITVLRALESGKSSEMVSPVTAEALIAKYSAALGIEPEQQEGHPTVAQTPAGGRSPFVYVMLGLGLGVAIAAVCLGIFFLHSFYTANPPAGHHSLPYAGKPAPPASAVSKAKRSGAASRQSEMPKTGKRALPVPGPAATVPSSGAGVAGSAAKPEAEKKAAAVPAPAKAVPPSAAGTKGAVAKPEVEKKAAAVPAPAKAVPPSAGGAAGAVAKPEVQKKAAPVPAPAKAVPAPGAAAPAPGAGGAGAAAAPKGGVPAAVTQPGKAVCANNKPAPVPAGQPAQAPAGGAAAVAPKQPQAAVPAGHSLEIAASQTAWVHVVIDGRKREGMLMQPGQIKQWRADKRVSLVVGNAGGVHILWDGKPVQISKEPGRVIRLKLSGN